MYTQILTYKRTKLDLVVINKSRILGENQLNTLGRHSITWNGFSAVSGSVIAKT